MSAAPEPADALDGGLAEAIARRVAELVAPRPPAPLLTAEQVAAMLQVRAEWVYEHAAELGALRLGSGGRGRLRFDAEQVRERLRGAPAAERGGAPTPTPRRRRSRPGATPLLRVGPKR
jgi:hypothetical protein